MSYCVSLQDVIDASNRIKGIAHRTPVFTSEAFNEMAGRTNVFFKTEAMQKTGSFKFRGATNAIRKLLEEGEETLHVVTHSSGNHAQALAKAANAFGVKATIVMPNTAPEVKRNAVAAYGGEIVLVENSNEAREEEAARIMKETGAKFIHPSEDPNVIAGQGTVCLELLEQADSKLDVVIIPVGGGGLASGNCMSLKGKAKIVLAEPEELDDAKRSFEAKELLKHDPGNKLTSVADGLKTTLGPNTWPIIRDHVDDIFTVSEKEILQATKLIWERLKICIEPSAGVGVAVCLSSAFREKYPPSEFPNVGVVLCGGNVDVVKTAAKMQEMGI